MIVLHFVFGEEINLENWKCDSCYDEFWAIKIVNKEVRDELWRRRKTRKEFWREKGSLKFKVEVWKGWEESCWEMVLRKERSKEKKEF